MSSLFFNHAQYLVSVLFCKYCSSSLRFRSQPSNNNIFHCATISMSLCKALILRRCVFNIRSLSHERATNFQLLHLYLKLLNLFQLCQFIIFARVPMKLFSIIRAFNNNLVESLLISILKLYISLSMGTTQRCNFIFLEYLVYRFIIWCTLNNRFMPLLALYILGGSLLIVISSISLVSFLSLSLI